MPQVFKIGGYLVYFWVNENDPLEPVHVHIAEGKPVKNGTKIWLTKAGGCILQNNNSQIPDRQLRYIMQIISARHEMIIGKWKEVFGERGCGQKLGPRVTGQGGSAHVFLQRTDGCSSMSYSEPIQLYHDNHGIRISNKHTSS